MPGKMCAGKEIDDHFVYNVRNVPVCHIKPLGLRGFFPFGGQISTVLPTLDSVEASPAFCLSQTLRFAEPYYLIHGNTNKKPKSPLRYPTNEDHIIFLN